jgi:toxic anion resistance family protein
MVQLENNENNVELQLQKAEVFDNHLVYKEKLKNLPEVKSLTNEIDVRNPNTILSFGQAPSEGISKVSDQLLANIKKVKAEEASEMLVKLTKVMDQFDLNEIKGDANEKNFVSKIFGKVKSKYDDIFKKYDSMSHEIDEIYVLLKQYQQETVKANDNLQKMYLGNKEFFESLEKYVVAGELGQQEIEAYKNQIQNTPDISENDKQMQVQKLTMMQDMLSQRTYDLQIAENVALQTAPMIQMQQMANYNLARKINNSFIITLPIFKQALAQAIMLKRQEIMANSMKQLDDKTNELLIRNAQNTANQSVKIAKMASGSSIEIATLEKTFATIQKGITEAKQITEQIAENRKQDTLKLENMKDDIKQSGLATVPVIELDN